MRVNLPVTQREYLLRDDDLIVSRTDLKGRIVYDDADFMGEDPEILELFKDHL